MLKLSIKITILFGAIILFEVPSLVKNELWKELAVFSGLLLIALALTILGASGFNFSRYY